MFLLKILSALVALLLMASVRAEANVTIDDTDPQIVYQPPDVWNFQGNTALTQDRWNETTHFTSKLGATASLTFTGALYVYYVGYGIKEMIPPALVPITLQPQHGRAITVQFDSYRVAGAQAQTILFSSNRLDPTEMYTITVTKTNATLGHGVNIDSFILTQPDRTDSTSSSPAQTTVASGTTLISTESITSLVVPDSTSTASGSFSQSISTSSAKSSNASPNAATIVGGVFWGIATGMLITFLVFRWWLKQNQQKRGLVVPDGLPIHTDETPRPTYFAAPLPYPSKRSNSSPQATMSRVISHHSVSTLASTTLMTPASTTPGHRSVKNRLVEIVQVQQTLPYTPPIYGKAQYMGNSQLRSETSVTSPPPHVVPPSPGDTEYWGDMLPEYS